MKKNVCTLFTLIICFNTIIAQTKQEKLRAQLIGTWKFQDCLTPNGSTTYQRIIDVCEISTLYEFKPDGSAVMRSDDTTKCNTHFPPQILWEVIQLHDSNGKEYDGVRIMEEDAPRNRGSYDENTYTDMIFLLIKIKKNTLCWVKKSQYHSPSVEDRQSIYRKISDNK